MKPWSCKANQFPKEQGMGRNEWAITSYRDHLNGLKPFLTR